MMRDQQDINEIHLDPRHALSPHNRSETRMKQMSEAGKRLGVRIHAAAFVVTILALVVINLLTGAPYWVVWVVPGWTIGLFCHWYFTVGPGARAM